MPFSRKKDFFHIKIKKIKKNTSYSLQVLRRYIVKRFEIVHNPLQLKRVCLFISQKVRTAPRKIKAGISLEAAIVTSVFMFAVLSIISLLLMLNLQEEIQMNLENIGRKTAQNIYFAEEMREIAQKSEVVNKINNVLQEKGMGISEDEAGNPWEGAAFDTYAYGKFITAMGVKNINNSYILGGVLGLDFTKSQYKKEEGIVDFVLDYTVKLPFLPRNVGVISDRKRVLVKAWNGTDITKEKQMVYITKNGSVYHSSRECPHINIDVTKIVYMQLQSFRNNLGEIYEQCKSCGTGQYTESSVIYVTKYGDSFHTSLSCGGISRSVMIIERSQVGDRKLCKDCEKRKGVE